MSTHFLTFTLLCTQTSALPTHSSFSSEECPVMCAWALPRSTFHFGLWGSAQLMCFCQFAFSSAGETWPCATNAPSLELLPSLTRGFLLSPGTAALCGVNWTCSWRTKTEQGSAEFQGLFHYLILRSVSCWFNTFHFSALALCSHRKAGS